MTDKTAFVSPENTTSALSNLAFCALAALGLARHDGIADTPYAENLFLIRRLATAQKQKRCPRSVAIDIQWLLDRGRKHGLSGHLRQHLEYLWHSCCGNLTTQSGLFRLTYASGNPERPGLGQLCAGRERVEVRRRADTVTA
ncbi:DUF2913 family protein [Serratia marcescens]|uniref:DUF2913 family protein n=1 Tax=Serratia marcescens TaxID=615 RepID=UPI003FA690FC